MARGHSTALLGRQETKRIPWALINLTPGPLGKDSKYSHHSLVEQHEVSSMDSDQKGHRCPAISRDLAIGASTAGGPLTGLP